MPVSILATKLYIPPAQPDAVARPHLIARLNQGRRPRVTLVSAPAGFGKTTLVSEWSAGCGLPVAWLSLDERDADATRFLAHLVAALQTIDATIGAGLVGAFRSPQPPSTEAILTHLLNDIVGVPSDFVLVLDDYHVVGAKPVDDALAFLIEHLPPPMQLVIATREDPQLPLARLRSRGQLTELRAADLRFTPAEATTFLNEVMGLNLSTDDIMALEARTEGWIAGLQLAALTMRGREDAGALIRSFTGSHRFVLDYLMEEVLTQQSPSVQTFLLRTAILDRLSGPLAETVVGGEQPAGQSTLEYLERANLFIVPLDDERRWYRYHHLFAELLRQRLQQSASEQEIATLHRRASQWFEEHGLELEAFHHAVAANDIERAERLIAAKGAPLYTRGAATPVLNWLDALPPAVLDARPWLWVMAATALAIVGRMSQVELKLQAAEAVIDTVASEERRHDLIGRIADLRALLGLMAADPHHLQAIIAQSHRAPEDFHPDNLTIGPSALWKLGLAHLRTGNRAEAGPIFTDAIAASEASGNIHVNILATTSLGRVLEHANELHRAAETYQHALQLVGNPPGPIACEAHAGLARITYEWNDLDAAHRHGRLSVELARQLEIASFVPGEVLLARLQLAQRDPTGALAALERTAQEIRECGFLFRLPEVADAQVPALIALDRLADAERLARAVSLPLGLARVQLAQRDAPAALATLAAYRRDVEARGWPDEALRTMTLQAIAHSLNGDDAQALSFLTEALVLAAPGGHIRLFVDEGLPMARLLSAANERGDQPDYLTRLLAAFADEGMPTTTRPRQPLVEPLSERELEILRLISQGLSNQQIGERLFIALSTVKGHNRNIFGKLQVQRRTEAIARARELDLL